MIVHMSHDFWESGLLAHLRENKKGSDLSLEIDICVSVAWRHATVCFWLFLFSHSVCYATTEEKYPSQCQVLVSCCTSALILFGLTQNIVQDYFQELEYNMQLFWSTQTDTRKRFMFWRECTVKFVHALVLQHTNTHLWIYSACKASKARAITLSFLCWKFLLGNMNCQ